MSEIRLLPTPLAGTGESPVWDETIGRIWWVDIRAPAVHRTDPATGATETWPMAEPVGSLGLCRSGALLLGLKSGIHRWNPGSGDLRLLAAPEADRPANRLNDGKVSPEGRFLVGSMGDPPQGATGALHRYDPDGTCVLLLDGVTISNGLAWSPDGRTLYHADSRSGEVAAWDYDLATGAIAGRRLLRRLTEEEGRPDGAAMDTEGGYWSAGVSAGRLNRILPDGSIARSIALPVARPTMPCFFGPGLRHMFVTSLKGAAPGPQDGACLVLDPGAAGVPVARFAD